MACFGRDRGLLILDNFEHLLAAGPLVANLLACNSRSTVLVTSRVVLRLSGEQILAVPPLSLPAPASRPQLGETSASEAVCLFLERARAHDRYRVYRTGCGRYRRNLSSARRPATGHRAGSHPCAPLASGRPPGSLAAPPTAADGWRSGSTVPAANDAPRDRLEL